MQTLRLTFSLSLAVTALGASPVAMAQGKPMFNPAMMGGGGEDRPSAGGAYRTMSLSMPVVTMTRETVGRLEFNLAGKASMALEGMAKGKREEVSEKDMKETGESREAQAKGAAIFVSRYMDGSAMAGLYWGLGLGYRKETIRWRVKPDENDKQVNMGLRDDDQKLHHDAELAGTTGHARFGYRYVGVEVPFVVGAYLGARHFQAGVRDADVKASDANADSALDAPMTDDEKERLRRQYTTKPEAGIELGISF